ncbi:hypothetical protein KV697_11130 [Sphingomonas sanguinis]|uniref:hypothetical protein n=1 Tax=Sphingomonas sanguinis TaxID=33051 RepID=UPI001C59DDC9|nr:hypothetical protein [Sphingomonas sanguinis]QXT34379.1 hypothetical protein KV697_11130 [Sphingomonas sanguinis]
MRDLTIAELELISGGYDNGEDIVVTGSPYHPPYYQPPYYYQPPGYYPPTSPPYYGGGGSNPPPAVTIPESFNVGVHHVDTSHLTVPLTAEQKKALDDWKTSIANDDAAINALPDNAVVRVKDDSAAGYHNVLASELKSLWSKMNFTLEDQGHVYPNGTTRGESDYNNGSPKVSFNVDLIAGYAKNTGGLDYVALHELGHLSSVARDQINAANADGVWTSAETTRREQIANDTAKAITDYSRMTPLSNPGYGYSPDASGFSTPAPSGGSGGGVGGGGGRGGGGREQIQ